MRAIHPGETLKGKLEELNLSANACAKALNVPTNRITAILNGHAASLPRLLYHPASTSQNCQIRKQIAIYIGIEIK